MENEIKTEETEEVQQEPAIDLVAQASAIAERLEKANAEAEVKIAKAENLAAFAALGGKSEVAPEVAPEEETPVDYVKRVQSNKA